MASELLSIQATGAKETLGFLSSIRTSVGEFGKKIAEVRKGGDLNSILSGLDFKKTSDQLQKLQFEIEDLINLRGAVPDFLASQLDAQIKELQSIEKKLIAKSKGQLEGIGKPQSGGSFGESGFTQFSQNMMHIQRIFKNTEISEFAMGLSDFADGAQSMSDSISALSSGVMGFYDTVSGVFAKGGGLTDIATGLFNSISPLGAVASVAQLAVTALGVAIEETEKKAQAAAEAEDLRRQLTYEQGQLSVDIANMIKEGDYEGLQQAIANTNNELAKTKVVLDEASARKREYDKTFAETFDAYKPKENYLVPVLGGVQMLTDALGYKLDPTIQATIKNVENVDEEFKKANEDTLKATQALNQYTQALAEAKKVAEAKEALEALKTAESELTDVRKQASDGFAEYQEQLATFAENAAFERKRELEDRTREDTKRELDYLENRSDAIQSNIDEEIKAYEDYTKTISKMRDDLVKQDADALSSLNKDLANLELENAESRIGIEKNYMTETQDNLKQHLKDLAKSEEAYQKERRRRLEDLQDELLQAEQSNDVIAFLNAQKQGEKDLKRMAEDNADQNKEANDSYAEQSQQRREQFQKELKDLAEQGNERRVELITQYNEQKRERKQAFDEQLIQERQNYDEQKRERSNALKDQLAQMVIDYQKQGRDLQAERDFQDKRRKEDAARSLADMQKQYDKQQNALSKREDDLIKVIESKGYLQVQTVQYYQLQAVDAFRVGGQNAVNAIRQAFNGASYGTSTRNSYSSRLGGYGSNNTSTKYTPTAFAEGGIATSPTLALIGEKLASGMAEAVIPFKMSEGIGSALARYGASNAMTVVVSPSYSAVVGDIASGQQVSDAFRKYDEMLRGDIVNAIAKARNGRVN